MDNVRQRLRHFSADLHQQVDDAFSCFALDSARGYSQFLLAHAAALFSLERSLEAHGIAQLLNDWPQRQRSAALHADLRALQLEAGEPLQSPRCVTPGWCWGAAYVLEGSRLGGQVLARRVRAAQPEAPLHYLTHATEQGLWPRFLQQLETGALGMDEGELQRGVQEAFGLFLQAALRQSGCDAPAAMAAL